MALQKMPELENTNLFRQPDQLHARNVTHRLNLVQGVFHGRGAFFSNCFQGISLSIRSKKILRQVLRYLFLHSASQKVI